MAYMAWITGLAALVPVNASALSRSGRKATHTIAVEPGDIDGTHLELAHGLQFGDQGIDGSR
jgi:hypothetical protein